MGSNSQDIHQHLGCGTEHNQPPITLNINTTTGGSFSVTVEHHNSVENLKKIVAKKLKVAKDRICLLHREKELHDGTTLKDNGIMDGSRIILLPNVETGLLAHRPENTVMQALESLNDSQVNDFLSGKTPLNLSMRLGDHMMLIQLQLSTVNPSASTSSQSTSGPRTRGLVRSRTSTNKQLIGTNADATISKVAERSNNSSPESTPNKYHSTTKLINSQEYTMNVPAPSTAITTQQYQTPIRTVNQTNMETSSQSDLTLPSDEFENLRNMFNSLRNMRTDATLNEVSGVEMASNSDDGNALLEQSPIKSLSNLVSSPIKTSSMKTIPTVSAVEIIANSIEKKITERVPDIRSTTFSDPITAKLTSCLCKHLDPNCNSNGCETNCHLIRHKRDTTIATSSSSSSSLSLPSTSTGTTTATIATPTAESTEDTTTNVNVSNCKKAIWQWMHQNRETRTSIDTDIPRRTDRTPKIYTVQSSSDPSCPSNDARTMRSSSLLHRTLYNPIGRAKFAHGQQNSHHHSHRHGSSHTSTNFRRSKSSDNIHYTEQSTTRTSATQTTNCNATDNAVDVAKTIVNGTTTGRSAGTLAEASRNLTKTLRKLSKEVFTNKMDVATITGDDSSRSCNGAGSQLASSGAKSTTNSGSNSAGVGSGAVIESMRSHGKGIYSGTFSGTLNPALQDRYGRPKRDISTVIHILNDLLSATPHYSRGARISFEPTSTTRAFKHASSRRVSSNSSSHREHYSKCLPSVKSTCSYDDCNGHAIDSTKTSITICRRHSSNRDASSTPIKVPTTPTNNSSIIACHQCQSRLVHSAPVTPSATPTNTGINFNELLLNTESGLLDDTPNNLSTIVTLNHPICTKCSNMELENSKTKSKLDQLRLVMQQRKERREARKLKASPYGAHIISSTCPATSDIEDVTNGQSMQTAMEVAGPTNIIIEHVDTLA